MGGRRTKTSKTLFLAAAVVALLVPMPVVLPPYPLIVLCYALVFAIACMGLNLLLGTAGLLSLGHATFFGIAAYAGAFLYRFTPVDSFELYLIFGLSFSALSAAVIGFLCLRATRIHFTILTLAFCQIVYSLFIDGFVFRPFGGEGRAIYFLGGGGMYIPRLTLLGIEFSPGEFIPAFYNVIAVFFLGAAALLWRIDRSPFGVALRAIRDNAERAQGVGIPVRRYRWYAFVISGLLVGLAGALYGQLNRQITPEQLHWLFSAKLILATVMGGLRQFSGPLLGAFAFVALEDVALSWTAYHNLLLGVLLIIVVFAFPSGLAGGATALANRLRRPAKD
ncbi:MAG: branched-chain amino acid ABC transporter permease [Rhodospirillales bacterium]